MYNTLVVPQYKAPGDAFNIPGLAQEKEILMRPKDITNQRFGHLVAIRPVKTSSIKTYWECICDCGEIVTIRCGSLASGHTVSCGCHRRKHGYSRRGHGAKTSTYRSYQAMKDRCTNPKRGSYKNYGERGITVCDRWLESFENFLEDMGEKPKGLTLERIDNDAGYSPDNCKWATRAEQNRNRRDNVLVTFNGKTQCIAEWGRELGFRHGVIGKRMHLGWPIEKVLTSPTKSKRR